MDQYTVTGMSCAACQARVEKAVSKVPGVSSCSVSLLTNSMGVEGTASPADIIRAVEEVSPEPVLRMTMLLHDAGKPYTRTTDEKGVGHYRGHQACSAALAAEVLEKLRFDRESEKRIVRLVEAHDIPLSTERKILLRRLNQFGEKDLRALFQIHRADRIATGTRNPDHAKEHCRELNEALEEFRNTTEVDIEIYKYTKPINTLLDELDGNSRFDALSADDLRLLSFLIDE